MMKINKELSKRLDSLNLNRKIASMFKESRMKIKNKTLIFLKVINKYVHKAQILKILC